MHIDQISYDRCREQVLAGAKRRDDVLACFHVSASGQHSTYSRRPALLDSQTGVYNVHPLTYHAHYGNFFTSQPPKFEDLYTLPCHPTRNLSVQNDDERDVLPFDGFRDCSRGLEDAVQESQDGLKLRRRKATQQ
ncbi:hypothetical protein E4U30_002083 [Claviceps sp. LM220 group G6]|nr:hypothetical protein E4U30_002083 [Claviceps sp. LM220 group G6]